MARWGKVNDFTLRYDVDYTPPRTKRLSLCPRFGPCLWFGARPQASRLVSIKDEHARLAEETQTMQAQNEALEVSNREDLVGVYYGMRGGTTIDGASNWG